MRFGKGRPAEREARPGARTPGNNQEPINPGPLNAALAAARRRSPTLADAGARHTRM
jgi:hypothetical protein